MGYEKDFEYLWNMRLEYDLYNGIGVEMRTEQKIKAICSVNYSELQDYDVESNIRRSLSVQESTGHTTFLDVLSIFYIVLIIVSFFSLFFQVLSMVDNLKLFFFFADSLTLCIILVKLINRDYQIKKGISQVENRRNTTKFNNSLRSDSLIDEDEDEDESEDQIDDLENAFLKTRDLSDSFDINILSSYDSKLIRHKRKEKSKKTNWLTFFKQYWDEIYQHVSFSFLFTF